MLMLLDVFSAWAQKVAVKGNMSIWLASNSYIQLKYMSKKTKREQQTWLIYVSFPWTILPRSLALWSDPNTVDNPSRSVVDALDLINRSRSWNCALDLPVDYDMLWFATVNERFQITCILCSAQFAYPLIRLSVIFPSRNCNCFSWTVDCFGSSHTHDGKRRTSMGWRELVSWMPTRWWSVLRTSVTGLHVGW